MEWRKFHVSSDICPESAPGQRRKHMVTAAISLSLLTDPHLIHSDLLILSLNMGITTFDQSGK